MDNDRDMNLLDVTILLIAAGFAWLGWREGLLRALWASAGLVAGTALGLVIVPMIFHEVKLSVWISLATLAIVACCAVAVRFATVAVAKRVRIRIGWTPNQRIDRPTGAVFSVVAVMSASWILGMPLTQSNLPHLASEAKHSFLLQSLDALPLPFSEALARQLEHIGERGDFEDYLTTLATEEIRPVPAAPADVVEDPDVRRAARSVWRVIAGAEGAATADQGTVFLVGRGRVMTAAHVVDGADQISVQTRRGALDASVVVCDPVHDIAVLDVPQLRGRVLRFTNVAAGQPAVVIGFPGNGPLTLSPARVRERLKWFAPGVDYEGWYPHDAYSVRSSVHSGNSGGPLVSLDGEVVGLVVASSRTDDETGYALTRAQVDDALDAGLTGDVGSADDCG